MPTVQSRQICATKQLELRQVLCCLMRFATLSPARTMPFCRCGCARLVISLGSTGQVNSCTGTKSGILLRCSPSQCLAGLNVPAREAAVRNRGPGCLATQTRPCRGNESLYLLPSIHQRSPIDDGEVPKQQVLWLSCSGQPIRPPWQRLPNG